MSQVIKTLGNNKPQAGKSGGLKRRYASFTYPFCNKDASPTSCIYSRNIFLCYNIKMLLCPFCNFHLVLLGEFFCFEFLCKKKTNERNMKSTLLTLFFFLSIVSYGQSYKLYTTDKELSSSLINKIYQDRNGMIWVATEDGLNRYDGVKFTIYKHEEGNKHSLCHNYVRTLFEDSKGNMIIGTYNGLQLYDPATDSFSLQAKWNDGTTFDSSIVSILERKNGEIWISGSDLCKVQIKEDKLTVHKLNLPIPTTLTDCMIEDSHQNIWMSKGEGGIYRLTPNNKAIHYLEQEKEITVISFCEDNNGTIYAGTISNGLYVYDRNKDRFIPINHKEKSNLSIKVLYTDNQNKLFIGTDGNGLKTYHNKLGQLTDYSFENNYFDFRSSKVHSILLDNVGNLWLAIYQKGVMMIPVQSNNFKYIGYKSINNNIIGSSCITSLHRDHKGILWVGTDNDGIYGITIDGEKRVHYSPSDNQDSAPSTVFGLYEDSDNNLWFGSFTNGLGRLNKETGRCNYLNNVLDIRGKPAQRVYDFAEDNSKRLWIATMGTGLFYYDLKANHPTYNEKLNKQLNEWISCLLYAHNNKLYAGTYDGVYCIELDSQDFKVNKLLSRHIILSFHEDKKGIIWIGSAEGLLSWNPQTKVLSTYTTKDGLPSNTIYAIQGDEQGNLWISTNAGMSYFHPEEHKFVNYYVGDGLQGNEFSKNASFKDANGTIWFGGMHGITYFNPHDITNPAQKWNVRITDFYLHNKPVRKDERGIIDCAVFNAEKFHLSYKDNAFSIEFSTVKLNSPERITYLYAMDNDSWISLPEGSNRVSFSNMTPGTHRFRIKAMDYMIESEIKEITIIISPPWWSTWWAKSGYFLLILLAVWAVIIQIRHRYRSRQEMMQHIHAEEINEAKLQFFINVSHEIRTPMTLIISPLQKLMANETDAFRQKTYLTIYRNAERILQLINQLMDIRKIDKGQMSLLFRQTDMVGYLNELCDTFSQQVTQKKFDLQFHHEALPELSVWIDTTNFDKIILNILSNAIKFTPEEGTINICLNTGTDNSISTPLHHYVEIIITDNGIGIDPKETERIFERFYQIRNNQNNSNVGTGIGLHLTRSLVELHYGNIHAESNPNGIGSRFIIRLPMGCEHLRPKEIDSNNLSMPIYTQAMPVPLLSKIENEETTKMRSKTKYRVLIVEDDEEIRNYISQELSADYHILESCNGKEAMDIIFKRTPDLVISDVMMPEMDGLTLCRKIKQNVHLNHLPIILLTAKTREEDNIEGLETGADAYLTKPFNIEILRKITANLIRNRERLRNTFSGQQIQEEKLHKIEAQSPDDKLMERIMRVINTNLSNSKLTVEMISAEVGISRVHLHRKLKELTNQTTRDFIRNARLKQAAALLSKKRYTVAEVAELTGFSNPNNFSTAFKELYGIPPTAYMEEHLKK